MVVKEGGDNVESILRNIWPELKNTENRIPEDFFGSDTLKHKNLKKISENSIIQNGAGILVENNIIPEKPGFLSTPKAQDDLILCEIKGSKIVQDTPKQFHQDDKYADQIEELLKSGNLSSPSFIYFYL
jgi:hypothetical protein